MSLTFTILGSGSSAGVPRVAQGWGACDPANPRNHRRRCSLLIQRSGATGTTTALVDTSGTGFVEEGWASVQAGAVVSEVVMATPRCSMPSRAQPGLERDVAIGTTIRDANANNLGVYATVTQGGTVRVVGHAPAGADDRRRHREQLGADLHDAAEHRLPLLEPGPEAYHRVEDRAGEPPRRAIHPANVFRERAVFAEARPEPPAEEARREPPRVV